MHNLQEKARHGIALFTTCDLGGGRQQDLLRLLASVAAARALDGLHIRHFILLQRAHADVLPDLQQSAGGDAILLATPRRHSLSQARNILLERARREGVLDSALWVAFPDDDAWYPPCLLNEVDSLFANSADVDLVTCGYGAEPATLARGTGSTTFRRVHGYGELVRTVSSNTLMLRASAVQRTGGFDERLGIGAPINGGEDLDYALRACGAHTRNAVLSRAPLVGHRDRLRWVRSRYFAGSLFALARSTRSKPVLALQVARKLLVGGALVILRELSAAEYCAGIRIGLSGWFLHPKAD